ncbi:MAG: circadian clock protein KaiC [Bacteroidales bacterium]
MNNKANNDSYLPKCPTGIKGLDELTKGGIPYQRTTLVAGGPGCGKTVFSMEFLVMGIVEFDEPAVFLSFEEDLDNLVTNFNSMDFDLKSHIDNGKLYIDHIDTTNAEVTETGDFSLDPIFLRLEYAIQQTGAKRVVIDTIETIFSSLSNARTLRIEIKRLFKWLQDKKITAIVTGEQGSNSITRQGLEEYVSDCVILLDHRVVDQISKRRLRVVKYRGTAHVADESPFIIDYDGIKVIPVTSLKLEHTALKERVSTGIPDLDNMMDNKGFYRASSILISGTSGTGKSSMASLFANSACTNGEKCLYFSFEESVDQICRNMGSIGMDLRQHINNELLHVISERTSTLGLEEHLSKILQMIKKVKPDVLVMDPISNFFTVGKGIEIKAMLTRLLDYLKEKEITGYFTNLSDPDISTEQTNTAISSIMDTWLILHDHFYKNEKRRLFYLLKARGMKHAQEIKEMVINDNGIQLKDPDFEVDMEKK